VRAALTDLDSLADTRTSIDRDAMDGAGVFQYYTAAITALTAPDFGADSTADTTLRRGLQTLEFLGDAKECTGRERAALSAVFAARKITPADYQLLLDDLAAKQAALAQFARTATRPNRPPSPPPRPPRPRVRRTTTSPSWWIRPGAPCPDRSIRSPGSAS
jgi:hypothetical protein